MTKCRFVRDELGFADCINYKSADYPGSLAAAMPDGVDVYHDAVGGQMLTDALGVLKNYGTVVLCGLISQYNETAKGAGFNLASAIIKRAVMKGLIVFDFETGSPGVLRSVRTHGYAPARSSTGKIARPASKAPAPISKN